MLFSTSPTILWLTMALRRAGIPAGTHSIQSHAALLSELVHQALDLGARLCGENLLKLSHRAACIRLVPEVATKQFLAGFPVESAAAGIARALTEGGMKASAQKVANTSPSTDCLQNPRLDQLRQSWPELRWHRLFPVNEIEHQQLISIERNLCLQTHLFKEPDEARIPDLL